jgi:lysyl-tRNA synthetase class 2
VAWIVDGYEAGVVVPGHEALFWLLVGMVGAFAVARFSVRMIRAGVRWWPGNVRHGSLHIHHMVFGTVLMVVAGVGSFGVPAGLWRLVFAGLFGTGTGLVLDEFALILHLEDVYWQEEGRTSVTVTALAVVVVLLILLGFVPLEADSLRGASKTWAEWLGPAALAVNGLLVMITLLKGKYVMGLLGIFCSPLAVVGAIRLARPGSPWARWRYRHHPSRLARARRREEWRERWSRRWRRAVDLVAGAHGPRL